MDDNRWLWRGFVRGFLAIPRGLVSLALAPLVLPLAWLTRRGRRIAEGLPASIPTQAEMRVLERRMADRDPDATKLWFRGAIYREFAERYGLSPAQAEESAVALGDCAGEPDGFGVRVEFTRAG